MKVETRKAVELADRLEGFWKRMGFAPLPGVQATFEWRMIGDAGESSHVLDFWRREL